MFHSLRHWCASTLLAAGAPVPAVAGYLGDVPETVMRTYAHWLRDDRSLAATLLDQTFAAHELGGGDVTDERRATGDPRGGRARRDGDQARAGIP